MNEVRFLVDEREDLDAHEVVPVIDGDLLTDLIEAFERAAGMEPTGGYGGLIPAFFDPLDQHFHGVRSGVRPGAKTPLLACDCGEWGCWPLMARITVTDRSVTWDSFEQPHRSTRDYSGFGPFRFDRRRYDAALEGLCSEVAATIHR